VEASQDFEDLLQLFADHEVQYLIIGGLAFTFHAKPRFTKDIDLWVGPDAENLERANRALAEFGSPHLLDPGAPGEILQLGVAPNRIDLLTSPGGSAHIAFAETWSRRIVADYGSAPACWIDLDGLIAIKAGIDDPRQQEDARVLREVRDRRERRE
jgi:hypothetical protein